MSTLNTVNITNGTDSITVEGAVKGSAKAWVNFNGRGTVAIRASYNVSSITDNGTGDYTVNFTTALADANYSVVVTGGDGDNIASGVEYGVFGAPRRATAPSTSSIRIGASNYGASVMDDFKYMYVAIFR